VFKDLCTQLQREKDSAIVRIKSDHGTKFENAKFIEYCSSEGIKHELSSLITPQQNEIWKGRKPTVKYFHVFGSKCYILADRYHKRKMDPKSDDGIFLGYSTNNRAYIVFNSRTKAVMESINVVIDDVFEDRVHDVESNVGTSVQDTNVHIQLDESEPEKEVTEEVEQDQVSTSKGPSIRVQKNHTQELIIGNPDQGITTRRSIGVISNSCCVSKVEPKNVKEALTDEF